MFVYCVWKCVRRGCFNIFDFLNFIIFWKFGSKCWNVGVIFVVVKLYGKKVKWGGEWCYFINVVINEYINKSIVNVLCYS